MGNWQADCCSLQWKCNKGNMREWFQLLQQDTTHDSMFHPHMCITQTQQVGNFQASSIQSYSCTKWVSLISPPHKICDQQVWRVNKRWKTLHRTGWKALATTFSNKGIQNLVPLYDECLNLQLDYIYQQLLKKILL